MMTTNNDFLVPSVDADDVQPLNYDTLPADAVERLQRYEADIWRYLGDVQQSMRMLAVTLTAAHNDLVKPGNNWATEDTFNKFLRRFYPALSRVQAWRLIKMEEMDPVSQGNSRVPDNVTSVGARLAFLSAPAEVQEKVREGDIAPRRNQITETALLAQKAQARAAELELALAKANRELHELEGVRQSAEGTLKLALKEAENSNLRLNALQDEMEKRVAAATASERATLEKQYTAEIAKARDAAEKARAEADKERLQHDHALKTAMANARKALQERDQLAEQLKHAGDDSSKWAKWEITSVRIARQLEQMVKDLPPEEDMAVWLPIHWQLMDEVIDAADTLRTALLERKRVRSVQGSAVEADK